MIRIIDKEVLSSDNTHMLKGKVYLPEGSPKGLFHVVHGMTEYIGRYDSFMREMAEYGWLTFGYDHLGHGQTALNEDEMGYIAPEDGWKRLVEDVRLFGSAVRQEADASLPFVLMGHSMGSFIVRLCAAKFNHYDKLIVMGTGGPNPAAGAGISLCKKLKTIMDDHERSDLVYSATFGAYNSGFERENDKYAWLSVDKKNRIEYRKDPYCAYMFTISGMQDLVCLSKYSNDKIWFEAIDKRKPILLVAGSEDPVGDHGKGVRTVYEMLKEAGANVEIKLYEGYRHEILRDYCRRQVIADIKRFIEK